MIDPRAMSGTNDMMRLTVALDILRLPYPPQDRQQQIDTLDELRSKAVAILVEAVK
jgi:hypothetical protein